jgi:pimeloyl-ACP methyl ester carboxylesterase
MQAYKSNYLDVNGIKLHYIEYPNASKPKLLLLHGLTANALTFNGLIEAGLNKNWHIIAIDFRGRGQSTKRAFKYSITDHGNDIIGLLDYLEIESIAVAGHSFGGLMSTWMAYRHPTRVNRLWIIDAAPTMNPKTTQMLMPALSRIDKKFDNFDAFIEAIKKSEYMTEWDDSMLPYYRADVEDLKDGRVECKSDIADVVQISTHVSIEPWNKYFTSLKQQTTIIVGRDAYTLGEPILPMYLAERAANNMLDADVLEVHGNHQTMLFGKGAREIVKIIQN